ncbi:MAG: DNA polymerase III subunit gamma/tau [Lachnospiraceae bacterium]|nr:DNA polymerase III subunit gamma/tau [Lachnospiraceae bacterium]
MSYTASYRKFRPQTFDDVKGQDTVVRTLRNQIKTERIGHAYLFCGVRGTGKTSVAKIFARAINCEHPVEGSPCGECEMCRQIAAGSVMNVVEIDAASNNSVDNIRQITDEVAYSPTQGRYKVYIIDEVHMLSASAFNALLKTLEEPPSYVVFILATTEAHKVLPTIHSRCQRYDFRRISVEEITARMTEMTQADGIESEPEALRYIARAADGAMRDAWSLLDRCLAFAFGEKLTYDRVIDILGTVDTETFTGLLEKVIDNDVMGAVNMIGDAVTEGKELTQFVIDFTWFLRNLLLVKSANPTAEVLNISNEALESLKKTAERIDQNAIMRYIRIFSDLSGQMKYSTQKRILLEVAVIKLCRPQMETNVDSVLDSVRALEKQLENGVVARVAPVEGGQPARTESVASKPKAPAVTEEIKKIVQNRASLQDALPQPLKTYVAACKMSAEKENELLLVTADQLGYEYISRDTSKAELLREFEDYLGKSITIDVRYLDPNEYFEDHYVNFDRMFGGMSVETVD